MAKKVVSLCDVCKNETEDSFHSLTFKKPGKKTGNKFEVCDTCAEKILTQLVASDDKRLNRESWSFNNTNSRQPLKIGNPQDDDDDLFVAKKSKERQADPEEEVVISEANGQIECIHMNRGPMTLGQLKSDDGSSRRGFFQRCRDCGGVIPAKSKDDKKQYENLEPDPDVRVGVRKP